MDRTLLDEDDITIVSGTIEWRDVGLISILHRSDSIPPANLVFHFSFSGFTKQLAS
jgi:hypothetical protein